MKPHILCRWLALAAALGLTACDPNSLPKKHGLAGKPAAAASAPEAAAAATMTPAAPMAPAPSAGPAMLRYAGLTDITGAWGLVPLPNGVNPSNYASGQFSEPYQYFQILSDGRFATVRSFNPPAAPVTDLDIQTELAMHPAYDRYTLGNGTMVIQPYTVTGVTFQGQQVWSVQSVVNAGTVLGTFALPGDLFMTLQNQLNGQPYYRILRRLPPAVY